MLITFLPPIFWGGWSSIEDWDLIAYAKYDGTTWYTKNLTCTFSGTVLQCAFSTTVARDANSYLPFVSAEIPGVAQEIIGIYGHTASVFKVDVSSHEGTSQINKAQAIQIAVFGVLSTPEKYKWKRTS